MKPQFRLFLWLSLLTLVGYGGIAVVTASHGTADVPAHIAACYEGDSGYYLSPQHQDASFRYASGVTEKERTELFATESEDDRSNQVQLKKHHPAVFNYFADFYGAGAGYAHLLKTRLLQDARMFHPSVQRYIALRVIRI